MQHQSGITITSELDMKGMQRASDMPYSAVLDLRFADQGHARPVEEEVLLRLRNLHVSYEQLPLDMARPQGWQKNSLMRQIGENLHDLVVITDQPEAVTEFCRSIDVPAIQASRVDDAEIATLVPQLEVPQTFRAGTHQSAVI